MSAHRPQGVSRVPHAAFWQLALNETRLAVRMPRGLILGLGLPLLLLIVIGSSAKSRVAEPALGGLTRFDLYVPILLCFAIAGVGLFSLPGPLATYREKGILRRLSTTPLPPVWVLAVQFAINLCIAVAALTLLVVISTTVFGFRAPVMLGGFLLATLLSICALFAIGTLIAAISPSGGAAYITGAITFFPLMFFAGLWLPRASMPQSLVDIGNYTPLGASVQAVQSALGGSFPPAWSLLVLAGYALALGALAVWLFRWE